MKKQFRKLLFASLLAAASVGESLAVPAYPWPIKVKQPDGTVLTIRILGDEHGARVVTTDGRPVYFEGTENGGMWKELTASMTDPLQGYPDFRLPRSAARKTRISDIPTTGHQKSLIILVEFSDKQFTMNDPGDFYHRMLNEEGYTNAFGATGSARDFYLASSNGLYDPEFVVVGPVRLPRSYSYYGADRGYQSGIDYQIADFVHDAAAAADELVDYSEFDSDHDGKVDNIYFFYAGYGEADTGTSNTIWPHSANYYDDFGETLVCDGMYINRYACSQELSGVQHVPVGIGTFVHEYGHVLGLADHYNTQNQQAGGPGLWDTMANGSYLNNQHTPPLFSAFERAELGWLDYTELTTGADSIISMPCLADSALGYRVSVPGNENEYFVIENRQPVGWDRYLPGHGLLVWHVDMDEETWMKNKVNDDPNHQRLDLIEADRTPEHDGGDTFPGTKNVTQFSFNGWSGDEVFGFAMIEERQPEVRFLLSGTAYELPAPALVAVSELKGRSALVSWSPVSDATDYRLTLCHESDTLLQQEFDAGTNSFLLKDLQPLTGYSVSVQALMATYVSASQPHTFTTTDLQFSERQVMAQAATNIQPGAFTARWQPLDGAEAYQLSLFRNEMSGRGEVSWDFTGQSASRPDGWMTTGSRFDNNYYGEAAPSLRLSKDGDHLTATHTAPLTGISFWYRAANAGNKLSVSEYADGQWILVGDTIEVPAAQAQTISMALHQADSVRIVFHRRANYVQIDDVVCEYEVEQLEPVSGQTGLLVGNATAYTFMRLPAGTYSYSVVGIAGDEQSLPSDFVKVEVTAGPDAITTLQQASVPTHVYDLQGRRVRPGRSHGLFITTDGRKVISH